MLITLAVVFFTLTALYLSVQTRPVQAYVAQRITAYLSSKFGINVHVGGVDVALFRRIVLREVWLEDHQADTLAYARRISATIDTLSFRRKVLSVSRLSLDQARVIIQKDSAGIFNYQKLVSLPRQEKDTVSPWKLHCNRFILRDSEFGYQSFSEPYRKVVVEEVRLRMDKFRFSPDSLSFQLFSMSLNDNRGFYLNGLSAEIRQTGSDFFIDNLLLETLNSRIESPYIAYKQQPMPGSDETVSELDIRLSPSQVSLADLSLFIPGLEGMDQLLEVSGQISGNIQNLKAREFEIRTGSDTRIAGDFAMNYIPGFGEPFLFLELKEARTNFRDLSSIRLPNSSSVRNLKFPDQLYQAGNFNYRGNFTGFPTDFVVFGTLDSKMGRIKTDISITPDTASLIRYRGRLETTGFRLETLLQSPSYGQISMNGMVNGTFNKRNESIDGKFDGVISSWNLFQYTYRDIILNGQLSDKKFDGNVLVDDPNLKLNFSGDLNLNEDVPVFDFILHVEEANLAALKLDQENEVSRIKFDMAANFSGNSLDNLEGLLQFFNGAYINQNDSLEFENLIINTHLDEIQSSIDITSDFADISLKGKYEFSSLLESFRTVVSNYIPAIERPLDARYVSNQFTLELQVKNLDDITAVFQPELKIQTPFELKGEINASDGTLRLNGNIPQIHWKEFILDNIDIKIQPEPGELTSVLRMDELKYGDQFQFRNLAMLLDASQNQMNTRILWNNMADITYSGDLETHIRFNREPDKKLPVIDIDIEESRIIIADSLWTISPSAIKVDTTAISIRQFVLQSRQQAFTINGKISENQQDHLSMQFQNIDLGSLDLYLRKPAQIKGMVNGSVGIFDFYRNRLFYSNVDIKGLEFRSEVVGDVSVVNKWDRETSLIDSELKIVKNNRTPLSGRGYFNPFNKNMMFIVYADHMSLGLLGTVIKQTFSNFHGDGTGKVVIHGTPDKVLMDGAIFAENAGLTIDFNQVSYHLNDSIRFQHDVIRFNRIEVRDINRNRGIFNGTIRHDNFSNMDYNLSLSSNQILALNTGNLHNDRFYGRAVAQGTLRITGKGNNVKLSGDLTTLPETNMTIVLGEDEEVTKYDFIRFVRKDSIPEAAPAAAPVLSSGGTEIDFTITVTPEARAQLIYNTQITDVIRAQGEGILRLRMDKDYNINLSGNYSVTQGEYLFTLQNVINKRFTIEPGGSMVWSGDPYNAVIDISAVYRLKASLRELFMGSMRNVDYTQRIPVDCKILLTDDLISPTINFDIVLPTAEDRLRDEVQQYFATQEDLNKQMLSLLVLGQFYTPEYLRGTYEAGNPNLIGNTASDLFSNQLSNWLSQINRDVDIGINYRPGNQLTNDEIELALSTQIFNDRVILNGNIGNNSNPNSVNNSELVGDFDLIVKLTPNGKLQLKAYNRANNNLIYETAPYTQGIGISYKEEYNTFEELWHKFLAIFRKEKRRQGTSPEAVIPDKYMRIKTDENAQISSYQQ